MLSLSIDMLLSEHISNFSSSIIICFLASILGMKSGKLYYWDLALAFGALLPASSACWDPVLRDFMLSFGTLSLEVVVLFDDSLVTGKDVIIALLLALLVMSPTLLEAVELELVSFWRNGSLLRSSLLWVFFVGGHLFLMVMTGVCSMADMVMFLYLFKF